MTFEDRANELLAFATEIAPEQTQRTNGHSVEHNGVQSFDSSFAVIERAAKYLAKMPIAVDGSNGSKDCFKAACVCVKGFLLTVDESLDAMREWNANCQPPWSEHELRHKLTDAAKASGPSGYLRKTREENWKSVCVPEYTEPKKTAKQKRAEPETTRTTLREATRKHLENIQAGTQQLIKTGIQEIDYAIGGGAMEVAANDAWQDQLEQSRRLGAPLYAFDKGAIEGKFREIMGNTLSYRKNGLVPVTRPPLLNGKILDPIGPVQTQVDASARTYKDALDRVQKITATFPQQVGGKSGAESAI